MGGVGGKGPFLYLFEMQPVPLEAGRLALVQGFIRKGGISFGLVSDGQWIAQAGVTRPGEFTVVVRVPTTGTHSLVLATTSPARRLKMTSSSAGLDGFKQRPEMDATRVAPRAFRCRCCAS